MKSTTQYQQRWRLRQTPLIDVVRALLAVGVPCDTGGHAVACCYCGEPVTATHREDCVWQRLRDRAALEKPAESEVASTGLSR